MSLRAILLTLALLAAAVAAAAFLLLPRPRAVPPPPAPPQSGLPAASPAELTLSTSREAGQVFQHAFWRRPQPEDQIEHAERREWISPATGIAHWQWFLAFQPGPALRTWLEEDNPFRLSSARGSTPPSGGPPPPDWFPDPASIPPDHVQSSADGQMLLIRHPANGLWYLTDRGSGFTPAAKAR